MANTPHITSQLSTAELLNQLSDPIRLRMMRILCLHELAVGELVRVVQIPQSSGSRHLKILAEGGWVVRRSVGPATYYRVVLDELSTTMRGIWLAVRDDLDAIPESSGDDQRVRSVLSERMTDSSTFFGEHAGEWDGMRNDLFGQHFTDRALLSLIDPRWRVADLGCGTGNCTELLSPWVERVVAVDRSSEMLEGARTRMQTAQIKTEHIEFLQGELSSLPLSDGSVDAAVCALVMHHLPDPNAALNEMRRVLTNERGGGVVLLVDMCEHSNNEYRRSMGHAHLGFSHEHITGMLTEAGFGQIRINTLRPDMNSSGPPLFAAVARVE
jgi:ubiquinone/menaquinone biosynthesis C-methylase UbiE/DNA-binding transcriptional ArsR family regulator